MAYYYLNKNQQPNGDYEVHTSSCTFRPTANSEYLGDFLYCWQAVDEAKRRYPSWYRINGCYFCCNPCHSS